VEFEEWYDSMTEMDRMVLLREVWDNWAKPIDLKISPESAFVPVGRCECAFSQDECETCETNREAWQEHQRCKHLWGAFPEEGGKEQYVAKCVYCGCPALNTESP